MADFGLDDLSLSKIHSWLIESAVSPYTDIVKFKP